MRTEDTEEPEGLPQDMLTEPQLEYLTHYPESPVRAYADDQKDKTNNQEVRKSGGDRKAPD